MIGIVNYGGGNIFSLKSALNRVNVPYGMINVPEDFDKFTHIIIPGVGHAGKCMMELQNSGLVEAIKNLKKPVLGICVGMQLLTQFSEEGNSNLLQLFPLNTKRFPANLDIKIPHMGWNEVNYQHNDLFLNIKTNSHFYFVHSYYVENQDIYSIATTKHGVEFAAAIQRDNFYGVQFHPEKSGNAGEQLLFNFQNL
ncbi:imidazole glycerol phosphate synthase subunit HisH [Pedobacter flavus]|uniref:Imidazole glycerol phosphate synthase subunit HisH n=1 Tax=Pedobacter flavus TaxID=3113906 RepID=A0ABU7H4H9_9SPHI|nr:imidazole glycerol phosphate synthase subunit HisH [Pedobacter sp. VNH31]MEE1885947.1 imidazole glycerol phosphate synthase subunit HisH [Pedobacter sp. VNH31]